MKAAGRWSFFSRFLNALEVNTRKGSICIFLPQRAQRERKGPQRSGARSLHFLYTCLIVATIVSFSDF